MGVEPTRPKSARFKRAAYTKISPHSHCLKNYSVTGLEPAKGKASGYLSHNGCHHEPEEYAIVNIHTLIPIGLDHDAVCQFQHTE